MSDAIVSPAPEAAAKQRPRAAIAAVAAAALGLLVAGLAGHISAAWGFALLIVAWLALFAGAALLGVLVMSRRGQAVRLASQAMVLAGLGAAAYVLGVGAMAGHYTYETFQGRMELHWIIFGPLALGALVAVEGGIYRKLIQANAVTWGRYSRFIRRQDVEPSEMRKALVDDVIVQRSLWQVSKLRWLRHTLIFWGFGAMFLTELAAVFFREAVPAFGWTDLWRTPGHPLRLAFDMLFDATGLMMLVGCVLALYWRLTVRGKPESKFADTPMVLFLLFVVVTGFLIEGWAIAQTPGNPTHAYSFVGIPFSWAMVALGATTPAFFQPLWLVHVVASCTFIGYLPATRLVHTCAVPVGRLMNSQKGLLIAKKMGVLAGLMGARQSSDVVGQQTSRPSRSD